MGIYNYHTQLPKTLQNKICLFGNTCNPNATIPLSGSIVKNIENIKKERSMKLSYFQKEIAKCESEKINFTSQMF